MDGLFRFFFCVFSEVICVAFKVFAFVNVVSELGCVCFCCGRKEEKKKGDGVLKLWFQRFCDVHECVFSFLGALVCFVLLVPSFADFFFAGCYLSYFIFLFRC